MELKDKIMETDQVGFVFGHKEYRIRPNLVCWLPSSGLHRPPVVSFEPRMIE